MYERHSKVFPWIGLILGMLWGHTLVGGIFSEYLPASTVSLVSWYCIAWASVCYWLTFVLQSSLHYYETKTLQLHAIHEARMEAEEDCQQNEAINSFIGVWANIAGQELVKFFKKHNARYSDVSRFQWRYRTWESSCKEKWSFKNE